MFPTYCYTNAFCAFKNIEFFNCDLNKRNFLITSGIPLIHPLVDLGNYVMLEIGAPMHLFDLDKLNFSEMKIDKIYKLIAKIYNLLGNKELSKKIANPNLKEKAINYQAYCMLVMILMIIIL